MATLVPENAYSILTEVIKFTVPVSLGVATFAFLAGKMNTSPGIRAFEELPMVPLANGNTTHEQAYESDRIGWIEKQRALYGDMFKVKMYGQTLIVVSGTMIREVFINENMSFADALNEITGTRPFIHSVIKSNKEDVNTFLSGVIRDLISPNLMSFTPRIVNQLQITLDKTIGRSNGEGKLIKDPLVKFREMIASAMAVIFVGSEIAADKVVMNTFMNCTKDFSDLFGKGKRPRADSWVSWLVRKKHTYISPMRKHVDILMNAAKPVILERKRLEAEQGENFQRPDDILQQLLDRAQHYKLVDLEDICGFILLLVFASVNTTTDFTTYICYYLAAFPQYYETLHEEMNRVLDEEAKENGNTSREWTAAAVKKMAHLDSFVRESVRYRLNMLELPHYVRKDSQMSNGVIIPKGQTVICNLHSTHYGDEQGENPHEFNPWRFVGQTKTAARVGLDFLPFGLGKRACPGRYLSIQEIKTVICMIVTAYSKIEFEDPVKGNQSLHIRFGSPVTTGLIFTSR
ncbi:cytochrome P450 [Basidiobolus meristosporus CBS 931.73]|uniref:Cytochrome P450 n=1 Tax=Basidiobolus meristosporus CBS 931.73 TaxID=1314790 RepID=A0A1Y1YTC1_9FUNG|nr:cytochrome P450 [Basidiobolus meristosporus CBS 931.73]|eukprot:ORY01209.1 cytochrome P450 [Basidiobolus meristosporus CBS 931.73]